MAEVPGVTVCAHCHGPLTVSERGGDKPVQWVEQACADCGDVTLAGLCWYPNDLTYDIVSPVTAETVQCAACSEEATVVVVESVTEQPTYQCSSCLGAQYCAVVSCVRSEETNE